MVKRILSLAVAVVLLAGCGATAPKAGESSSSANAGQGKPYQATFSAPNNPLYQTQKILVDGKGHVRMEIVGQGPTVINVLDQNSNQITMWTEGVNKAVRKTAEPMDPLVMRMNVEKMPKDGATALGAKNISGHNCHGYTMNGTEVWFDDDYGIPVQSTSGGVTCVLSQFSPTAPDASVFEPPPGYEVAVSERHSRTGFGSRNSRIMNDVRMHMH